MGLAQYFSARGTRLDSRAGLPTTFDSRPEERRADKRVFRIAVVENSYFQSRFEMYLPSVSARHRVVREGFPHHNVTNHSLLWFLALLSTMDRRPHLYR